MITLLEIIRRSEAFLAEKGIARPRREAEEVIADVLELKRLDLYLQFERPLNEKELPVLRQAIQRRAQHEPLAYISGKAHFADLTLLLTPDVLIPRPETEILVENITNTLKQLELKNKVLWDMCCGSGCIGIALKKRFPELQVILSDVSEKALEVARQNAATEEVTVLHGDLFAPFASKQCDFFVCNPPYISESEYLELDLEVRKEPRLALVGGVDGLAFYRRIASELNQFLKSEGLAWLELGSNQGTKVKEIFESHDWQCRFEKDWAGHDRFFYLSRP